MSLKEFPHQIKGWKESFPSGFGPNAKLLTTEAIATKQMKLDYWNKNAVSDAELRSELGIQ